VSDTQDEQAPLDLGFARRRPLHIGYTVESIPEAVDLWARAFGAGPFFVIEDIVFDEIEHRHGPAEFDHSTAFGQWGGIAVELWEVHKLAPKATLGPRISATDRPNHVAYHVEDLKAESDRLQALGFELLLRLVVFGSEIRIHDAPQLGHTIEIQTGASVLGLHAGLAAAAEAWDGSNPLRPMSELRRDTGGS